MMRSLAVVLFDLLLVSASNGATADHVVLTGDRMKVVLSGASGRVRGVLDGHDVQFVSANEDRYDLEGTLSSETDDRVTARSDQPGGVIFECVNQKLGLAITKEFRLEGNVLLKRATYARIPGKAPAYAVLNGQLPYRW